MLSDLDPVQQQAADIVIDALRARGIDPFKAITNGVLCEASRMWVRGELTDADFKYVCQSTLILNPSLVLR